MDHRTPAQAAAALADLGTAERAVRRAQTRGLPLLLVAEGVLVLVDYAAKDLLPGRRARHAVTAACVLTSLAVGMRDIRRTPVQPVSVDPDDLGPRAARPFLAALGCWVVAERVLVHGLRRSRLHRPNLAIGLVLAAGRPLAHLGTTRLLPRPGHRG